MERKKAEEIIDILNGKGKADLVVKNAKVVDVYNKEVFESPVAVKDGLIIGFSSSIEAQEEFDAEGKYLIPGLIDAHCHIESSHLTPPGYSDAMVPNGVTTVIADPHEIANVSGLDGIDYMLESSAGLPLSVFIMFPSCVPATPFELFFEGQNVVDGKGEHFWKARKCNAKESAQKFEIEELLPATVKDVRLRLTFRAPAVYTVGACDFLPEVPAK